MHFAIDDFGTGYSNLNYLQTFSARKLKIDRIFINTLGIGENDAPLVAAIISIADSLGMKAVAEGIESKPALEKLIKMGCDLGQGYYWSKPLPAPEIERFLSNHQQ